MRIIRVLVLGSIVVVAGFVYLAWGRGPGGLASAQKLLETDIRKVELPMIDTISTTNSIGMNFVYLPPGSFMRGSGYGNSDENSVRRVTLTKGFYIQTTEVTQGQWKSVMGRNPSHFKDCGDDCPVEKVSWEDVQEFMKKLNQRKGSDKYRLPTEVEWEYACRTGSSGRYSFGNDEDRLGECARNNGNSRSKTHPVGQKKPNAWGLYDMHGNVWEWCEDWYNKRYPVGSVTDPTGPSSGNYWVLRGGFWYVTRECTRCAYHFLSFPDNRSSFLGFRVARTKK